MKRALILASALCATALCVAACTEEATAPAKQQAAASGEVLGGSISDAMIPLDQIESQAPLAPRQGPTAANLDAAQPEIIPAEGVEGAAPSEGAEATASGPAPEPAE